MRVFDGLVWACVATVSTSLAGCRRPTIERPPTYQVKGSVFVGGMPAEGARVLLWETNDPALYGLCPHAVVQADGSFRVTTYKTGDGARPGHYAVLVTWPAPAANGWDEGVDRFGNRYAEAARPLLRAQVAAADVELEPIHIR